MQPKIPYAYVNVLEAPFIREKLRVFLTGQLIRNCLLTPNWSAVATLIEEMSNNGSLLPLY